MSIVFFLHQGTSNAIWMFFLALGVWGAYRAIRGEGIDGNYLGALAVGQGLVIFEVIIGFILYAMIGGGGSLLRPSVHILYGLFAAVFIPFIYFAVLRGDDSNRGMWVMTFCTLFMFGVGMRSIEIGQEVTEAILTFLV